MKITYQTVLETMKELSPNSIPTFEMVRWFIAFQLAEEYTNMGTKELARALDGKKLGIETQEDINNYLEATEWNKIQLKNILKAFGYNKKFKGSKL